MSVEKLQVGPCYRCLVALVIILVIIALMFWMSGGLVVLQ